MATLYSTINQIGTYVYSRGYSSYTVSENNQRVRVSVSAVGEALGSTSQYSSTCSISGAWQVSATLVVDGVSRSLGNYSGSGSRSHSVSSSAPYYIDRDGGAENHYDISKSTSAKTVTLVMTYKLWGSTTYTGSINISVPAKTKYTITYNANGGSSGSITSQSYYYGDTLVVSDNATPTRDGYLFRGWATSSSATSASYLPGESYSNINATQTWYAVWELSAPTITYANAYRVESVGSTERMQNGTVGYVVFHRKGSAAPITNGVYATVDGTTEYAPNSSAKEAVVDLWFSNLDLNTEYQALLNVTDANGTTTSSVTIPKSVYPIDVDPMLERIDFGYDVNFTGNLTHNGAPVGGAITIDSALSETSVNPVQNRVLTSAINSLDQRILFDTKANWDAQTTLVGKANTIYVYTDYMQSDGKNVAGIKIGDGNAYLLDNPFIDQVYYNHINDLTVHITSAEREFWNNKVRCYYSQNNRDGLLIFTTN